MSITGTGFFIILFAMYGFFFNKNFLYNLTIFFIPFSATAVLNIGSETEGSAIQPYMFLSILWMVSFYISRLTKRIRFQASVNELRSVKWLLAFACIALLSLIMPILIDGKEMGNRTGKLYNFEPIRFSNQNITQYLYLLLGILFCISLFLHNRDEDNYKHTIKVYGQSIIFVMFWGILELISGKAYPKIIFNNSYSGSAGGAGTILTDSNIHRISSVTVEPSVFAQTVIVFLPFLFFSMIQKKYIFGKKIDIFIFLLLIAVLFLSTSAGGILSIVAAGGLITYNYLKSVSANKRAGFFFILLIVLPLLVAVIYFLFKDILDNALFNKGESGSALERGSAVSAAWQSFLNHPILGNGWGAITSFDLFVKILSNTGILGCVAYTFFLIQIIINQRKAKSFFYVQSSIKPAIITAFAVGIFGNIILSFTFAFGYIWLVMGLAMVTGTKFYKSA